MSYKQKPERYNKIHRHKHPNWAGWRVIEEQKQKPDFPANLKDRKELLDDLEFSYYEMQKDKHAK